MHSIHVFITHKSYLQIPIDSLKCKDLPQGFIIFDDYPNSENPDISVGSLATQIAYIRTDYFGGAGEQSATLWINGKMFQNITSETHPINEALMKMGVKRNEGMDEFDTIGLGGFRENDDIWESDEPTEEFSYLIIGDNNFVYANFTASHQIEIDDQMQNAAEIVGEFREKDPKNLLLLKTTLISTRKI